MSSDANVEHCGGVDRIVRTSNTAASQLYCCAQQTARRECSGLTARARASCTGTCLSRGWSGCELTATWRVPQRSASGAKRRLKDAADNEPKEEYELRGSTGSEAPPEVHRFAHGRGLAVATLRASQDLRSRFGVPHTTLYNPKVRGRAGSLCTIRRSGAVATPVTVHAGEWRSER